MEALALTYGARRVFKDNDRWSGGATQPFIRQQWQALYRYLGSFEETMAQMDEMVAWQSKARPPEHIIRSWRRQVEVGEAEIPDQITKAIENKVQARWRAENRAVISEAGKTLRHLMRKVREGSLSQKEQVQLLYLGNTVNYGIEKIAAAEKTERAAAQPATGNTFNFIAPPPPKKQLSKPRLRTLRRVAKEIIEGTVVSRE